MYLTYFVLFLGALYLLWHGLTFNYLVNARNAVQQSWSGVEVELKRRLDLIDSLVEVVKGYAGHESKTLEDTVRNRNFRDSTRNPADASNVQPVIQGAIKQLFALAEAYPDLKAGEQFLNLQKELTTTEDRIAERRHAYNQNVSYYQNIRLAFPQSLLANLHSFSPENFFDEPDEKIQKLPEVKFS